MAPHLGAARSLRRPAPIRAHAAAARAAVHVAATRSVALELLPAAKAQTLRTLEAAQHELQDLYAGRATPTIVAYSTLAATAGAVIMPASHRP